METAADMLGRHKSKPMLEFPENDEFAEWVEDALETDAYYVGLASSGIEEFQTRANLTFVSDLEKKLSKFAAKSEEERDFLERARAYLLSLKALVAAFSTPTRG